MSPEGASSPVLDSQEWELQELRREVEDAYPPARPESRKEKRIRRKKHKRALNFAGNPATKRSRRTLSEQLSATAVKKARKKATRVAATEKCGKRSRRVRVIVLNALGLSSSERNATVPERHLQLIDSVIEPDDDEVVTAEPKPFSAGGSFISESPDADSPATEGIELVVDAEIAEIFAEADPDPSEVVWTALPPGMHAEDGGDPSHQHRLDRLATAAEIEPDWGDPEKWDLGRYELPQLPLRK